MIDSREIPHIDPIASETRRVKRRRRLGGDAACVLCGSANIDALTPVSRSLLEAHHVVGRANDEELTVALCLSCHAIVTEGYRDAGVALSRPPTFLHKLAAILRALGALLSAIGEKLAGWAQALIRVIERLDDSLPVWRTWEQSKL